MQFNLLYILILLPLSLLTSCNHSASDRMDNYDTDDSIPIEVHHIREVLAADDSTGFASMISYPLERPYPLKDIRDSVEMKSYYSTIVDDSLKNIIAKSANKDWKQYGWRGWTLADGEYLWLDGKIYDITYLSHNERRQLEDLISKEIESLPEDMRGNWLPAICYTDPESGSVYRIDSDTLSDSIATEADDTTPNYRLAVYKRGADLHKHPSRMLKGKKHRHGSSASAVYYFSRNLPVAGTDSAEFVIEEYSQETGEPTLYNNDIRYELIKTYWLDLLNSR